MCLRVIEIKIVQWCSPQPQLYYWFYAVEYYLEADSRSAGHEIPSYRGTSRSVNVFTRAHEFHPHPPNYLLISVLIVSSHLSVCIPRGVLHPARRTAPQISKLHVAVNGMWTVPRLAPCLTLLGSASRRLHSSRCRAATPNSLQNHLSCVFILHVSHWVCVTATSIVRPHRTV